MSSPRSGSRITPTSMSAATFWWTIGGEGFQPLAMSGRRMPPPVPVHRDAHRPLCIRIRLMASRAMRMQDASSAVRYRSRDACRQACGERNEDSYLARPEPASGRWRTAWAGSTPASSPAQTVIEALGSIETPRSAAELLAWCEQRVVAANTALHEFGRARGGSLIGTTIAVLLAYERHFACVWSGDSRIYLVRGGAIASAVARSYRSAGAGRGREAQPDGGAYLAAPQCRYPRDRRACTIPSWRSRTACCRPATRSCCAATG